MSESVKPRFAIDLNDIERQLAQAGAPPAKSASATRNDPLAELARIVGQDDPFHSLLANEGSARPRQQTTPIDDLFAARDNVTPASRDVHGRVRQGGHDGQAPGFDHYPQVDPRTPNTSYASQHAAPARQEEAYGDENYAQDYYDESAGYYAAQDYAQPERLNYPSVEKGRSRKGMIAIGAVLGAAIIGGGGAYMFGGSSTGANGTPPLIKAMNEPTKVQPQNPGGVEIPNQNKQIYERANQSTETKIVNREEQPVDVKQAVRMNGGTVADATGTTVAGAPARAQQPANSLNLGEPRKVRTVTIRPDGTVVGAEGAQPSSGPAPVPAMTLPVEAQSAPAASPVPAPVRVVSTEPRPVASTPVVAPSTPAPKPDPAAATPTSSSSPQKNVASAQPVSIAPPAAASETATSGGFAVQLGLANSESGAETAFAQFQRKYPDLEGMQSLIRKAEVNGNTIYRVRVGPMSREDASSLCSKLQGQGGQCFVAKN
jgi:hypothetical protein